MPGAILSNWPRLTLSQFAFILEMSLSTNRIKTTRLAVTARCRLDERVSPDIHHRDARLKQLLAPILAKGWDYSNKMIKDHLLACTTKMFEIFKNDG
jgi:hypothetical protein